MADSRNRQLAQLGTGLDVNESTGAVVSINMDTDVVSEGSGNLYFTNTRVTNLLAQSQSYGNITTNGFLRGPSNFVIDPAAHGDDTGKVVIAGDLQVDGTTTTINSTTLDVDDLNITLAKGAANGAAANGAGITIDGANATLTYDSSNDRFVMNKSLVTNIIGTVSDISNHDTDSLSEGSTNLYYTDARVITKINATSIDALSDVDTTTNVPTNGQTIKWSTANSRFEPGDSFSQSDFDTAFAAKDTDDLSEGTTNFYYTTQRANADFDTRLATKTTSNLTEGANLYYTSARFNTAFTAKSTDDLSEGSTNLYYTNTRFDTRFGTKTTTDLTEGTNLYYTTARSNTDFDTRLATKTTTDLAEGTNLYFTDARVTSRLNVSSIDELNDVDITTTAPTNGQVLIWDTTQSKFLPGNQSGGSGGSGLFSLLDF